MNKYRESVEYYLNNRQKIKESKVLDDQKWSTIIEGVLLEVMYEIPSRPEVVKCVVNAECILRHAPPVLLTATGQAIAWGEFTSERPA